MSVGPTLLDHAADTVAAKLLSQWGDVREIASAVDEHGVCHLAPPRG